MDPTALSPEVVAAVTAVVPNATFWLFALGVGWKWWGSMASHMCEFIAASLKIADKFADNGLDVRLTITNIDAPPTERTNREEED